MNNRASIFSQDVESLSQQLEEWNVAKFRSAQICSWLFEKKIYNPEQMLNIPKPLLYIRILPPPFKSSLIQFAL